MSKIKKPSDEVMARVEQVWDNDRSEEICFVYQPIASDSYYINLTPTGYLYLDEGGMQIEDMSIIAQIAGWLLQEKTSE